MFLTHCSDCEYLKKMSTTAVPATQLAFDNGTLGFDNPVVIDFGYYYVWEVWNEWAVFDIVSLRHVHYFAC